MVRSTASFLDKLRAEKTGLRYENEPALRQLAEKIAAFPSPSHDHPGANQSCRAPECWRGHTSTEDGQTCENRRGHCDWRRTLSVDAETCSVVTPASKSWRRYRLGNQNGHVLQKSFVSFHGGVIRVPINPPGPRRKFDVQWTKRMWVGRRDESDGRVVLTPHGTVTGRSVRRPAGNLRVQPDLVGKIKSRVQDPAFSQAELLKVLLASVPIRLAGETDTDQLAEEQDRATQREHVEGIVDERARGQMTRPQT